VNRDDQAMVISIKPEPTPEELAAITAAITTAVRSIAPAVTPPALAPSRWLRQGRRDAMRGIEREEITDSWD
jgi:hypothetical protein